MRNYIRHLIWKCVWYNFCHLAIRQATSTISLRKWQIYSIMREQFLLYSSELLVGMKSGSLSLRILEIAITSLQKNLDHDETQDTTERLIIYALTLIGPELIELRRVERHYVIFYVRGRRCDRARWRETAIESSISRSRFLRRFRSHLTGSLLCLNNELGPSLNVLRTDFWPICSVTARPQATTDESKFSSASFASREGKSERKRQEKVAQSWMNPIWFITHSEFGFRFRQFFKNQIYCHRVHSTHTRWKFKVGLRSRS